METTTHRFVRPSHGGYVGHALASIVEMPTDHIREAGDQMKTERMKRRLLEKVNLIRAGNTAILPTGEIVARGTTGSMDYDSPNAEVWDGDPKAPPSR